MHDGPGYGLWSLVVLNSAVLILFAFSFTKPTNKRDWRSLGAFSAFVVALFTEMYGFPLTIYLLSGWLQSRYPEIDLLSHDSGHLWNTLFGWDVNPHLDPLHLLSNVFIIGGLLLLAAAWRVLHAAQKERRLATDGVYARLRHPQYLGFLLIMFGFLLQWPTIPTFVMFPVLALFYIRLAAREEKDAMETFGDSYSQYMEAVPGFLPFRGSGDRTHSSGGG